MLPWDVRLQHRYGFYAVYVVLTIVYAGGIRLLPPGPSRETALILVLFSDPSFLSFYFIAALVLFEKGEGVVDALVTSPLSTRGYLLSKSLSLTALALATTVAITVLGYGSVVRWLPLLAGVGLTSILFVLVGVVAVARFDSINAYFMTALLYMSVLGAPVLGFLGIVETPLFYLLPAKPPLVLIEAAVSTVPTWEVAYAVVYLLAAIPVAYVAARRSFERHLVAGVEPGGSARPPIGSDLGWSGGPVTSLVLADLKNWLRDPLLAYIGLAPVLIALAGRYLIPFIATALVAAFGVGTFYPEWAAAFTLLGPALVGFAVGFFVLEDRDQGTLTALRLTPLTGRGYVAYRLAVALVLGFLAAIVIVPISGLVTVRIVPLVGVAAVASLYGAITALLLATLADNAVEGIAISKFFGALVMAPVIAIAVVPTPWQYLAGVLPVYWPARALVLAVDGGGGVWLTLFVGTVYQLCVLAVLVRRFVARAD